MKAWFEFDCTGLMRGLRAAAVWAALLCAAGLAAAHDLPSDVRVQVWVKPEGTQLLLWVRVPLGAMNEVDLPLRGPGYLDLARADAALRVAGELWFADNLSLFEDGRLLPRPRLLATRVALAADRTPATWPEALAQLHRPALPVESDLYWKQQQFDLLLAYSIAAQDAAFAIEPRLARMGLRVATTLRFTPAAGPERAFAFHGNPGLVQLDPRWHQVALRFVQQGFWHTLEGSDHLLFLACLVLPLRRLRSLLVIATAFTVAHSLTLAATAFGLAPSGLWFAPLVETLIAASIVLMALENLLGTTPRRRWRAAFVFGLVHGFGFAFALGETMQFAGAHQLNALLAFNLGVELAQVAVLLLCVPLFNAVLRRLPPRSEGVVLMLLSALLAHTGWHWLQERWAVLAKFPLPLLDAASLATLLQWLMAALAAALLLWAAERPVQRWLKAEH